MELITEEVLKIFLETMSPEEIRDFSERATDPEGWAERERLREEQENRLPDFVRMLEGMPAAEDLSDGFEKSWSEFLGLTVGTVKENLLERGIARDKLCRFVTLGWAFYDETYGSVRYRFGPPSVIHAVQVILVHQDAQWLPPAWVEIAVWQHPLIRRVSGNRDDESVKVRVLRRLSWAENIGSEGPSRYRLQELAGTIKDLLLVPESGNSSKETWIPAALESEQFWSVVASAIDLGTHINARRLFLDGSLANATYQNILNGKTEKIHWFLVIDEIIREQFQKTGMTLKPRAVRKLLGCKGSMGSEDEVMVFSDKRLRGLGDISWAMFQKYAKRSGRIWAGHRTD